MLLKLVHPGAVGFHTADALLLDEHQVCIYSVMSVVLLSASGGSTDRTKLSA